MAKKKFFFYFHDFTYVKSLNLIRELLINKVATKYDKDSFTIQLPDLTQQQNIRNKDLITYELELDNKKVSIYVPYTIYHTLVDTKAIKDFYFIKADLFNNFMLLKKH